MIKKKLSLGEKIALAASGAGTQEDEFPEDIEYDTSAKVVDADEDEQEVVKPVRSSLRTKNIQLLDELDDRYSGLKVSRKKIAKDDGLSSKLKKSTKNISQSSLEDEGIEDSSQSEASSSENDFDETDVVVKSKLVNDSIEKEEDESELSDDNDELSGSEEESSDEGDDDGSEEEEDVDDSSTVQTLSSQDQQSEIDKGKATLNQIRIWDSLLEVRIRLQKMLLDCNRLPHSDSFEDIVNKVKVTDNGTATMKLIERSQEATKVLMHELLRLQGIMVNQNTEIKKVLEENTSATSEATNDNPMDEEITSEEEEVDANEAPTSKNSNRKRKLEAIDIIRSAKKIKPEGYESSAVEFFQKFIPYRNQTIQKWNDKTQFAGGKFNKKASQQISTLRQIEQILSNKERLLKRTQLKRSNYTVIGATPKTGSTTKVNDSQEDEPELDPEIFDDDDFYHQLLRELIERKTSNVNDPIQLSHHWLELQKLRSKLKRKVDTKASKGRKIRYDVHSKLVNFMAPQNACTMSTAAVKELFMSLFGKTKE